MSSALRRVEPALRAIAALQGGVITRAQLRRARFTAAQTRAEVCARRWQVVFPGVYLTHTGAPSPHTLIWAAVLHCGDGAAATGRTALWLAKAVPAMPAPTVLHIAVPETRKVGATDGLVVVRRRHLEQDTVPRSSPPRVGVEVALLEATASQTSAADVLGLVFGAVQRRTTTASRLLDTLAGRRGHRWATLLRAVLADTEPGVQSPLEHRYLVRVERAHGLPPGRFNHADRDSSGRRRYRDVAYVEYGVIVELDGREAHPRDWAHRDRRRDNDAALRGSTTLRYGWREVETDACGVAAEVVSAVRSGGWTGSANRCGPDCALRP